MATTKIPIDTKPVLSGIDDLVFCVDLSKTPLRSSKLIGHKNSHIIKKQKLFISAPSDTFYKVYNFFPKNLNPQIWKTHIGKAAPITLYRNQNYNLAYLRLRKVSERYTSQSDLIKAIKTVVKIDSLEDLTIVRVDFFVDIESNPLLPQESPIVDRRFKRTHHFAYEGWSRYGTARRGAIRIYNKQKESIAKRGEYHVDPKKLEKPGVTRIEVSCKGDRLRNLLQKDVIRFSDLELVIKENRNPFYMIKLPQMRTSKLRCTAKYQKKFYYFQKRINEPGVLEQAYDFASQHNVIKTWFPTFLDLRPSLLQGLQAGLALIFFPEANNKTLEEMQQRIINLGYLGRGEQFCPVSWWPGKDEGRPVPGLGLPPPQTLVDLPFLHLLKKSKRKDLIPLKWRRLMHQKSSISSSYLSSFS